MQSTISSLLGHHFERNININLKMGHAPIIYFMPTLFDKIVTKEFNSTEIILHKMSPEEASNAYKIFNDKEDECVKVILKP